MRDGGLWQRSGVELLQLLAEHEAHVRRAYASSLELIAELAQRNMIAELGYPDLTVLLRDVLRISTRDARRRLGHAEAVTEAPLVSGGTVPAALPVTAAAVRDGVLAADQIEVITSTLRNLPPHVPDADREFAERTMVEAAHELDAGRLARVSHRIRAWLDDDGTPPNDRELANPLNELHLATRPNGRVAFSGTLDRESSALLVTTVSALARPRPRAGTGPDPRTPAERQGDAFVDLLHLAASTGGLPAEAGEKPHLTITVPLATLRGSGTTTRASGDSTALLDGIGPVASGGGHATLDGIGRIGGSHAMLDGIGRVDAESARRLACDAKVIPAVLGSRSEPLDLGRATYTVSTAIRRALVLRDGGCAFPGCDRPHQWCHSHHIQHWVDGGPTDLHNLVLLCGQHHRLIHHSDWECAIRDGCPEFQPPAFVDPTRKPRRNTMHRHLCPVAS